MNSHDNNGCLLLLLITGNAAFWEKKEWGKNYVAQVCRENLKTHIVMKKKIPPSIFKVKIS